MNTHATESPGIFIWILHTNLLLNIYKHYSVLLKLPVLSEWPVAG